jgi:hypothetical protein
MNVIKRPLITPLDVLLCIIIAILCVMLAQIKENMNLQIRLLSEINEVNQEISDMTGVMAGKSGAAFTINGEKK